MSEPRSIPGLLLSKDIFPVGEVLSGTYEIRSILGAGGMGQVFEAQDLSLNRRVAIKAAWPDLRESVRKEAQALAAIRHPSMVTVFCIGTHKSIEFVVMERIYGVSLDTHLHRRRSRAEPLSALETIELLMAIGEGLTAVHRAGVAHRDIKPSNIMLAPANRVVLMDFGLFLPEFEVAGQTTVAGSPQYMAPEAISNEVQPGQAHLVDLYALGIVAFEMLTGDVPFNSDDILEVWEKHLTVEVPDVRRLRPDIPPTLSRLIGELVAKEPHNRPQNIEVVVWQLGTLRDILLGRTAARPPAQAPAASAPSAALAAQALAAQALAAAQAPAAQAPAAAQAPSPPAPSPPIPGPPTPSAAAVQAATSAAPLSVLIVDDDKDLRRVLSHYVKKAAPDAEIRLVEDGDNAIEAVRQRAPDLMLLDLQMPRMNGIEVVMYLRGFSLAERTMIVSVSAGAQEHDVQLLQQLGITRFVSKGLGLQAGIAAAIAEARQGLRS